MHRFRTVLFFFFISFLTGCLLSNVLFENMFETAFLEFKTDTVLIFQIGSKKASLLFYYFFLHVRVFFLLIFFSYTNVYKLYSRFFLCYTGIVQGILMTFCIHKEHFFKGIFTYLCFLTPHALILAPFFLFSILFLQKANETRSLSDPRRQKRELLLKQLPFCLLGISLIFSASFLEAYVNLPLLKKIL